MSTNYEALDYAMLSNLVLTLCLLEPYTLYLFLNTSSLMCFPYGKRSIFILYKTAGRTIALYILISTCRENKNEIF